MIFRNKLFTAVNFSKFCTVLKKLKKCKTCRKKKNKTEMKPKTKNNSNVEQISTLGGQDDEKDKQSRAVFLY